MRRFGLLAIAVGLGLATSDEAPQNMNGFAYSIANPHPNGKWTGEYGKIDPTLDYVDVYSPPISTLYAQVYWTMMDLVPLPPTVVQRFANKTMAIRGYECNQAMETAGGIDIPVPISAAYNHHHTAWICLCKGSNAHTLFGKRRWRLRLPARTAPEQRRAMQRASRSRWSTGTATRRRASRLKCGLGTRPARFCAARRQSSAVATVPSTRQDICTCPRASLAARRRG